MKKFRFLCLCAPLLLSFAGCTLTKSENPLSPSVAGPIPGVNITAPNPIEPRDGRPILRENQPLTLTLANATSSGVRPLSYLIELATDAGFANVILVRGGVAPGADGRTSFRLPDSLGAGRTYYWRAKAQDGANDGPYSPHASFEVVNAAVYEAPALIAPVGNITVSSVRPTFTWANAGRSGSPIGAVVYEAEASESDTFVVKVSLIVPEQGGQTSVTPPQDGIPGRQYYWRVRVKDSNSVGPWSLIGAFRTPSGDGGGGGGGGPWQNCGSTPGEAIVICVANAIGIAHTVEGAFEIVKRVAWLLRGSGAGLLRKDGGENVVTWQGISFSAGRIVYPDGHLYKLLSDIPTTNGPGWHDEGVDPALPGRWVSPIEP